MLHGPHLVRRATDCPLGVLGRSGSLGGNDLKVQRPWGEASCLTSGSAKAYVPREGLARPRERASWPAVTGDSGEALMPCSDVSRVWWGAGSTHRSRAVTTLGVLLLNWAIQT